MDRECTTNMNETLVGNPEANKEQIIESSSSHKLNSLICDTKTVTYPTPKAAVSLRSVNRKKIHIKI